MKKLLVLTLATSLFLVSCNIFQPTIDSVTYLSGSVSYYQNGLVRIGILESDTEIDDITYAAKTTIQFHENGKVYQGILAKDTKFSKDKIEGGTVDGTLPQSTAVYFDDNGILIAYSRNPIPPINE